MGEESYAPNMAVVDEGYVVVESRETAHGFCSVNPFGTKIYAPSFYVLKVNEGYPVKLTSLAPKHLHIWPVNETPGLRMPADVFKDKKAHDMAAFFMIPFKIEKAELPYERLFGLDNCFESATWPGRTSPASVLYLPYGANISHSPEVAGHFIVKSESDVLNCFYDWIMRKRRITTCSQGIILGGMNVQPSTGRAVAKEVSDVLEERFGRE